MQKPSADALTLADYVDVVGPDIFEELTILAAHAGSRSIQMVNSTAVGGGVAEMLHRVVPLLTELGIRVEWKVIEGNERFFEVTKSFHNALQGNPLKLTEEDFQVYLDCNEENARNLHLDADLVVIHDPQPAALVSWNRKRRGRWVWRCHIDMSHPNPQVWGFLRPYVERYDAAIFSSALFSPELSIPQFRFFPAIDPLDAKNRPLDDAYVAGVFEKYGVPRHKPVVTQISRYDPWKDPVGVVQAFKMARKYVDCSLLLVGDKAADDPESDKIVAKVRAEAGDDPDIHILLFSPSVATEINAFQRGSDVILQKSIREGFALTVSEALWKKRPVIGGAVGGIPTQIIDGHTGVLVHSVEGAALAVRSLLHRPEAARRLGENGFQRVKDEFLIIKNLKRYILLLLALDAPHQQTRHLR
ncbi:MAG: glycosyltransferase [Thermodesulfobacteriota bacterium]